MKLATALVSGMLVAVPAASFAQDMPYPDFQAVTKEPGKQNKAEPEKKPGILESVVETITGRSIGSEEAAAGSQQAPCPQEQATGGATGYPDFHAIEKTDQKGKAEQPQQGRAPALATAGSVSRGDAEPEKKPGILESVVESVTGRSVSPKEAGVGPQQAPCPQEQATGGATSYPDFHAIEKTVEPASQPQR